MPTGDDQRHVREMIGFATKMLIHPFPHVAGRSKFRCIGAYFRARSAAAIRYNPG